MGHMGHNYDPFWSGQENYDPFYYDPSFWGDGLETEGVTTLRAKQKRRSGKTRRKLREKGWGTGKEKVQGAAGAYLPNGS